MLGDTGYIKLLYNPRVKKDTMTMTWHSVFMKLEKINGRSLLIIKT